jgi:hypothetical protein
MPDRYVEILPVSPVAQFKREIRNKAKTYSSGTTLTYRVGNVTPEALTWLRAKVSGVLSFLRPACRISVICSVVAPTRTFSSFILHGWANKVYENVCNIPLSCPYASYTRNYQQCIHKCRIYLLTFPKVIDSREICSVSGQYSRGIEIFTQDGQGLQF